jgi:hypothetical protein|tara:strand:+ start:28565 stop:29023 length:459 start_codon:yes stop_codon:yes gene_type:complete
MTNAEHYAAYLVADQIAKRIESVGHRVAFYQAHPASGYGHGVTGVTLLVRDAYTPVIREQFANDFLDAFPDTRITREPGYGGIPEIKLHGTAHAGVEWSIDVGTGVCERVQVGTKSVEKYDSDALLSIPKITVDEPVYEYRCPDPILAGVPR